MNYSNDKDPKDPNQKKPKIEEQQPSPQDKPELDEQREEDEEGEKAV
jgi:hypothetical protein